MHTAFFKIASPRDLLDKAKRDYAKLEAEISTDTIFHFFVIQHLPPRG